MHETKRWALLYDMVLYLNLLPCITDSMAGVAGWYVGHGRPIVNQATSEVWHGTPTNLQNMQCLQYAIFGKTYSSVTDTQK